MWVRCVAAVFTEVFYRPARLDPMPVLSAVFAGAQCLHQRVPASCDGERTRRAISWPSYEASSLDSRSRFRPIGVIGT